MTTSSPLLPLSTDGLWSFDGASREDMETSEFMVAPNGRVGTVRILCFLTLKAHGYHPHFLAGRSTAQLIELLFNAERRNGRLGLRS